MYDRAHSLIGLVVAAVLLAGFSAPAVAQETEGDKARIAVSETSSKDGDCSSAMASALGDMLATSLVNTQKFVVLSDPAAVGGTGVLVKAVHVPVYQSP